MHIVATLLIAVSPAMDAFAVCLGAGTSGSGKNFRAGFRLAFHFGLFQAMMTVGGWYAGNTISGYIEDFDHWIAFALLAYVGIKMIRSGLVVFSLSRFTKAISAPRR